jgi:hypothetical protein
MVTGDINHTNRLRQRFLELNGYEDPVESSHVFNEAYQTAYSLRVILRLICSLCSPDLLLPLAISLASLCRLEWAESTFPVMMLVTCLRLWRESQLFVGRERNLLTRTKTQSRDTDRRAKRPCQYRRRRESISAVGNRTRNGHSSLGPPPAIGDISQHATQIDRRLFSKQTFLNACHVIDDRIPPVLRGHGGRGAIFLSIQLIAPRPLERRGSSLEGKRSLLSLLWSHCK